MTLQQKFELNCNTPSDIHEHLEVLKNYADMCGHVTEMGVRRPVSTYAFLCSGAKTIVSYDISKYAEVDECLLLCEKEKRDWVFIQADVLKVDMAPTDLLFIDTYHCYSQLKQELKLHSVKVNKFIALHDIATYGQVDEAGDWITEDIMANYSKEEKVGLLAAIDEFLEANPQWKIAYRTDSNNGLMIIEKQN